MSDITHLDRGDLPTTKSLLKATAVAAAVAAIVLLAAVLPAEYGIDPTGIGARLGLKSMSAVSAAPSPQAAPAPTPVPDANALSTPSALSAVWKSPSAYRSDELSLTLRPDQGAEIKAVMRKGERLVFTWAAEGGVVNFDMHGEMLGAKKDEFTSYWKGRAAAGGHGAFEAPFDGTHGWYWRNRDKAAVTIKVKTSGFYEKLYKP